VISRLWTAVSAAALRFTKRAASSFVSPIFEKSLFDIDRNLLIACCLWSNATGAPREWRSDLGRLIRATPELDWLLLTKRPENYEKLAPWHPDKIPPNVWLGVRLR
jgi:hypothetical protein